MSDTPVVEPAIRVSHSSAPRPTAPSPEVGVVSPDQHRSPFQRLGSIEVQLIMHCLDIGERLRLARCSRQLFADASHSFGWQYAKSARVVVNPGGVISNKDMIQKSLLKYVPNGLTFVLPLRARSFEDSCEIFVMKNMDGLELQQVGYEFMDVESLIFGLRQLKQTQRQRIRTFKCQVNKYTRILRFPIDELTFFPQLTTVHLLRIQLPHHFQTAFLRIPELTTLILDDVSFECETGGYWVERAGSDHYQSTPPLPPGTQRPETQSDQSIYQAKSKLRHLSILNTDMLGERYQIVWCDLLSFQLEEFVISNSIMLGFVDHFNPQRYQAAFRALISLKRLHLIDLTYYSGIYPYILELPALTTLLIHLTFPLKTAIPDRIHPDRITYSMIDCILSFMTQLRIEMTVVTHGSSNETEMLFLVEMDRCSQDFGEQFTLVTRDS